MIWLAAHRGICRMPSSGYSRLFAPRNWICLITAFSLLQNCDRAFAQNASNGKALDDSAAETPLAKKALELRIGPFDLHPRFAAGLTYDDNILYSPGARESDAQWLIEPGLQAVAGDDAALIAYRDQKNDVLTLAPGSLIVQQPEERPGKLFILDYGPHFQVFDKYTANNSLDEFVTLDLLWPMNKLILGLKQDYQDQKEAIVEADQRTTVENITTALSAAYQFGEKTTMESDLRRASIGYQATNLSGYTEYASENWFNYELEEDLPVSLGVLAGWDVVAKHQDQTYEQLRARARYFYTEKLAFDVSAGEELIEYENGSPTKLIPVLTIASQYQPAERTTLALTAIRQEYAAIYNDYNYTSTGASLDIRQGMTDRFTANLSGGYYSTDYNPVVSSLRKFSGDYFIARIGFEAKIVRHLNGEIYFQRITANSQANGLMNDNQVGVRLALSF
jgi:hypothetical protein